MTEFFIPLRRIPSVTSQEKGVTVKEGKARIYTKQEVQEVKELFYANLAKYVPATPLTGAVGLTVKWCYPEDNRHRTVSWKTTKPDTDNLIKLLKDVMTQLHFWQDDAQVASEINQKFYNNVPGIYVRIIELEEMT